MSISEFAVKKPISMLMIIISMIVLGFLGLQRLPLTFFPEIDSSNLRISVPYESSAPEEVERLITRPIEDVMGTLSNLKSMWSRSSNDRSDVRLEFKDGTDMDLASVEVRDRLDRVRPQLPDDVDRVYIRRWQTTDMPVFQFSVAWNRSNDEVYEFVNKVLVPQIQRIDGVANVEVRGIEDRKVIVDLDLERMRASNIDFYQLSSALRQNNINISGGTIMEGGREYTLRSIGEFRTVEEIANVPIRGSKLVLGDVADVKLGFEERRDYERLNQNDAVVLQIYKASTANVIDVSTKAREYIENLRKEKLYEGLSFQVFRDQSAEITSGLSNLTWAGIFGALLANLMLFVFLRKIRSTIIIGLAIPISIITTFLLMYILRLAPFNSTITLNIVSLSGLMFAVGMLVDPAVVVLENIFRHKQDEGLDAITSAIVGAREVSVAVISAVLTTVIVFVPMLFLESGGFSRWMGDFGIAIVTASVASLLVSLTLIPLAASKLFTGQEKKRAKVIVLLSETYGRIVSKVVRFPWSLASLAVGVAILYGTWLLQGQIDREWMRGTPERQLDLSVDLDRNLDIDEIHTHFDSLETLLENNRENLEISNYFVDYSKRRGRITVYFIDEENADKSTTQLYEEARNILPEIPGFEITVGRMRRWGGNNSGVEVQVHGNNTAVLQTYAEEIKQRLVQIPGIRDVDTSYERGDEELQVMVDRDRSQSLGLSAQQVARSISSALGSRATSKFKTKDREVDILVQLKEEDRTNRRQLENMAVQNDSSEMVQLNSITKMRYEQGPDELERDDRKATVEIWANAEEGKGMMSISMDVDKMMAGINLPPGYSWSMGRGWREMQEGERDSMFAIGLAIVLIYIVMASLFESFIHPFTILFSIPFAFTGVYGVFWATGTNLTTMGWLGILVVCGLVVNNGIILIDAINTLRRKGHTRTEAIRIGGQHRIRPILMTTLTTILGLAPMVVPAMFPQIFGPQEGRSAMYAPVGIAIVGGLLTSTPLTLLIMPIIYVYLDNVANWLRTLTRATRGKLSPSVAGAKS